MHRRWTWHSITSLSHHIVSIYESVLATSGSLCPCNCEGRTLVLGLSLRAGSRMRTGTQRGADPELGSFSDRSVPILSHGASEHEGPTSDKRSSADEVESPGAETPLAAKPTY